MGDRGNIKILNDVDPSKGIYLYTHWQGASLPAVLQKALATNGAWDDPAYLARVIFDHMTEGSTSAELGYGIGATYTEADYATLVVNTTKQRIYMLSNEGAYLSFGMYFKNFAAGAWNTERFWGKYEHQQPDIPMFTEEVAKLRKDAMQRYNKLIGFRPEAAAQYAQAMMNLNQILKVFKVSL